MNFISYKNTISKPNKASAINLNKFQFQPPPGFLKVNSVVSVNPRSNDATQHISLNRTLNNTSVTNINNKTTSSSSRSASRFNNTSNDHDASSVIMALSEGRGHARGEVGIAAIGINCPSLILCQLSDNFWYIDTITKIQVLNPAEILIPDTFCDNKSNSRLLDFLRDSFPAIPLIPVPRKNFNNVVALLEIDTLCSLKYKNVRLVIEKKYYALAAASAVIHYLRYVKAIRFEKNCLKLEYQSKWGTMMIDIETSNRLELLYPLCHTQEKRASIFGIVNNCVTHIGRRHLRANILEPSCNLSAIQMRLNCIKELIENKDTFLSIEMSLDAFVKVDQLLKLTIILRNDDKLRASQRMINLALLLKCSLEKIPYLCDNLKDSHDPFLITVRNSLKIPVYNQLLQEINKTLNPESQTYGGTKQHFNRLYAVRPNVNAVLDVLRNNYAELVDKIRDHVAELSAEFQQPLRMSHTVAFGFHIQLVIIAQDNNFVVPTIFEELQRRGKLFYLTTKEVIGLNYRINKLSDEILILSNDVISKMLMNIRKEMDSIYNLVGVVTDLDIIQSLTKISMHPDYSCPTFGADWKIIDAIHPLLDHSNLQPNAVANNVIATTEYNFFVITGPNMAGKTVYIKMIALIQIIAQLGCFVPAKQAQLRICDKLFSRIGFQDAIEHNASSFTMEMREMEYICRNITPNSLVVIDELCRSTNAKEGEILSWCFCEKLCKYIGACDPLKFTNAVTNEDTDASDVSNSKTKLKHISRPFIFVTTHFLGLTKLANQYPNVTNLHLSADERLVDNKLHLTYQYRVEQGVSGITGYGIALARCLRFPRTVIERSEELLQMVTNDQHVNFDFGSRHLESGVQSADNSNIGPFAVADLTFDDELVGMDKKFHDIFADLCFTFRSYEANEELSHEQLNKINDDLEIFVSQLSEDFLQVVANESISKIVNTTNRGGPALEQFGSTLSGANNVQPERTASHSSTELSLASTSHSNLQDKSYHSLLKRLKLHPTVTDQQTFSTTGSSSMSTDDTKKKSYIQQGTIKSILYSDNEDSADEMDNEDPQEGFGFYIQPELSSNSDSDDKDVNLENLLRDSPPQFDFNNTQFADIF